MAYVDRSLADHPVVRYRVHVPDVRASVARVRLWAEGLVLLAGFFLGYLALQRGPTSSASMLALRALAVAGAILYECWISDIAVSDHELIYERGSPQFFGANLPLRARNDFRRHREILWRLFNDARGRPVASVPQVRRRA